MYTKLLLLIGCVVCLHAASPEVTGRLLRAASVAGPVASTVTCDGMGVYAECNGCNSILVCLGPTSDTRKCDVITPSTPYCVNATCSAVPSYDTCPPPSLRCTGVGFYPDPNNCQLYHYCETLGGLSDVYECIPNYVYNAATGQCKLKVFPADCVTVKCDPSKIFVGYGTVKNIYAYCVYQGDKVTDIVVSKCAGSSTFNGSKCVFQCSTVGNFPHEYNKRQYYQCYMSASNKLTAALQSCGEKEIFDPNYGLCVPE